MQKLTFKKNKLVALFWDSEKEDWQERDLAESNLPISWFFPYETYVDEGVSLNDILTLLKPYESYLNLMFINYIKGIPFSDLVDKLKNADSGEELQKIDAICLLWIAQVKPTSGEEPSIEVQPVIMGLEMSEDEDLENAEFHSIYEVT